MPLSDSISERASAFQPYLNRWVMVDVAGHMLCSGRLADINEHYGSITLNPHIQGLTMSQNLPRQLKLVEDAETVVLAGSPFAITPLAQQELERLLYENNRDFQRACQEREKQLSGELEGKTDHRRQLSFLF